MDGTIIVVKHWHLRRKTSWPWELRQFYLNFNNIIDCKTRILLLIQLLNYLETKPPFIPAHISGVNDTKGAKLSWFFLLPYSTFSYFFYYTFLTCTINMFNEVSISIIETLEHTVHSFKLANFYFPSSFHPILDWKKWVATFLKHHLFLGGNFSASARSYDGSEYYLLSCT